LKRKTIVAVALLAGTLLLVGCGSEETSGEPTPVGLQPDVAEAAKEKLSELTGVSVEEIEIVEANQVEWTNTCLELGGPDEFCGQALTPGWRLMLRAEGEEYEVHTDLGGDAVRIKK
jgi:ABC-type glycerol-3-phosphate transport system substrate-binding protein